MRNVRSGAWAIAFVLLSRGIAAGQEREFRWEGALAAGKTIEVVGINGDIRAEPAAGGSALVTAIKRGHGDDPGRVTIDVVEHADGVKVCAIYPQRGGSRSNPCRESNGHRDIDDVDVTVDFTVHVPTGVNLVAETVNGEIEAEDLRGEIHAATVNGGVSVSSTGLVEASTVNGGIDAATRRGSWDGELQFTTVNGSIQLRLPADTKAVVEAETVNGSLTSDFPLTIHADQEWGPRRMEGVIGGGGGRLRLETVNGAIEIQQG